MNCVFIELPAFERFRSHYLDDEAFRRLQSVLMTDPEAGDVIEGSGGLHKLRFADSRRGKGKRGGQGRGARPDTGRAHTTQGDAQDRVDSEEIKMTSPSRKSATPKARGHAEAAKKRPVAKLKRDLFAELSEGFDALGAVRSGKRTLRTHAVAFKPAPKITPKELVSLRRKLDVSLPVFASYLRTNARTIENWEQGRAKPNAQAALLIKLVAAHPETVAKLADL